MPYKEHKGCRDETYTKVNAMIATSDVDNNIQLYKFIVELYCNVDNSYTIRNVKAIEVKYARG